MWLAVLVALAVASLLLCVVFWWYLTENFDYWKNRYVAGPEPQLLVGTFPRTNALRCSLIEELDDIYHYFKGSHRYVGIFTGRRPKLFILDPQLALEILAKNFSSFHDNESSEWSQPALEQLRPCSPFVTTGAAWKVRRAQMTPVLTANRIRAHHDFMRVCTERLVNFITQHSNAALDAKDLANRFTAESMTHFIWGLQDDAFDKQYKGSESIPQMAGKMMEQANQCVLNYGRTNNWPWMRWLRPVRFFPARTDAFFTQLARDVSQRFEYSAERPNKVAIQHLLQLLERNQLTLPELAGHTTTLLIDGYETAAIVIAHCLLLLARNQKCQSKLRKELYEAVASAEHGDGDNDSKREQPADLTYDALNELPYLEQCIQETLRIFPPLPTLFKLCTQTVTLKDYDGSELVLRPGEGVYISSYSFHHDPENFERPEDFWPERFDHELGGVRRYRDMGLLLPFGDGPRICPGARLGVAETKIAIADIIRNFEVSPGERLRKDNKIAPDSSLLSIDGSIELIFKKL